MLISMIAAMDRNRLIGAGNRLPWHLPADMQWFRRQTMGKPVVMGRNTFESIGRPLPGRTNLVLSRKRELHIEGCNIIHDLQELRAAAQDAEEVMIIGGAELYRLALPLADRLYLTDIDADFEGDAWFPEIEPGQWRETACETHPADDTHAWPCSFRILERIAAPGEQGAAR